MVEEKDVKFLQTVFDSRYRKVEECNDIMSTADHRMDQAEKSAAIMGTKLNILIGIMSFIAAALAPVAVKILFGG